MDRTLAFTAGQFTAGRQGLTTLRRSRRRAVIGLAAPSGRSLGRPRENCGTTNSRVSDAPSIPIWLVALTLAVLAPFFARAVQLAFERRLRRRTLDTITQAWPPRRGGIPCENP